MALDCDRIIDNLWQGSAPEFGGGVAQEGFAMLVLCAEEYQFSSLYFPGVEVINAPSYDDGLIPPTKAEMDGRAYAADRVADAIRAGDSVLVTCMAGRNRSGFVSALVLHNLKGWSGARCVKHIQRCRYGALDNRLFVRLLSQIPARAKP